MDTTPRDENSAARSLSLALRQQAALARVPSSLALRAAQRAVLAIARREPGPLLAVGFGAGLLAQAALRGLAAARSSRTETALARPEPPIEPPTESRIVGAYVETFTVQTIRFLRRP